MLISNTPPVTWGANSSTRTSPFAYGLGLKLGLIRNAHKEIIAFLLFISLFILLFVSLFILLLFLLFILLFFLLYILLYFWSYIALFFLFFFVLRIILLYYSLCVLFVLFRLIPVGIHSTHPIAPPHVIFFIVCFIIFALWALVFILWFIPLLSVCPAFIIGLFGLRLSTMGGSFVGYLLVFLFVIYWCSCFDIYRCFCLCPPVSALFFTAFVFYYIILYVLCLSLLCHAWESVQLFQIYRPADATIFLEI